LRDVAEVADSSARVSPVAAAPLDRSSVDPAPSDSLVSTVRSVDGATVGEASAPGLVVEPGSSAAAGPGAAASLVSADEAMPSSTAETPVQATATAAELPTPHNTT
jgi:hypothetical protein